MSSDKASVSFSAKSQIVQEAPSVPTQLGIDFVIIPLFFLIPYCLNVLFHLFTLVQVFKVSLFLVIRYTHPRYIISLKAR